MDDVILPLSDSEHDALTQCEIVIYRGFKAFWEVGQALIAIRDGKLYRELYDTFEVYCWERWNLKRTRAYELMDAASVATHVGNFRQIERESHAAELLHLEPDEQRIVWTVVQQTAPAGKVTAAHVKSVVETFKEVLVTRALPDGNGSQVLVSDVAHAAITEETYERMMRQKEHINGNTPPEKRTRINITPTVSEMLATLSERYHLKPLEVIELALNRLISS